MVLVGLACLGAGVMIVLSVRRNIKSQQPGEQVIL